MASVCVSMAFGWVALLIGWRMTRDFIATKPPEVRYVGWSMYVGAMLGMCIWLPGLLSLLDALDVLVVSLPVGLFVGLFAGYVIGKLTAVFFFDEAEDEGSTNDDPHA